MRKQLKSINKLNDGLASQYSIGAFRGMKKRFILLEDASTTSSFTNDRSSWSNMIDYSGSAPGGLLFAIYFSPGGGAGLFSSCSSQGLVTSPCAIRGALESGVFSFSGNVGLELCWLEQAWSTAIESGKITYKNLIDSP